MKTDTANDDVDYSEVKFAGAQSLDFPIGSKADSAGGVVVAYVARTKNRPLPHWVRCASTPRCTRLANASFEI
jgi:hypothetical protein